MTLITYIDAQTLACRFSDVISNIAKLSGKQYEILMLLVAFSAFITPK